MKISENIVGKESLFKVCSIKHYHVGHRQIKPISLFGQMTYVRVLSLKVELYKVYNEDGKLLLK